MSTNFFDSVYKYTDPVRYFKANDPYYFEVDNIPLKQLQENCNFLKDQISKLFSSQPGSNGQAALGRDNFTELQPYVDGVDNKVKVRPGRYTARINDAYSIQPLQFLTQVAGFNVGELKSFQYANQINSLYNSTVQKIRSTVAADALGMNGLLERTFIYSVRDISRKSSSLITTGTCPGYSNRESNNQFKAYPNWTGELFNALSNPNEEFSTISPFFGSVASTIATGEFRDLPKLETLFIKRWRGITRTAIVNVEEELDIEIPPFSDDDFFYYDENGQKQLIPATQRIDLVFIYSKPIDTSSTTINKFENQNEGFCGVINGVPTAPIKINKPILGLVKGAGLGVDYHFIPGPGIPQPLNKSTTQLNGSDEYPMILASPADSSGANMGFGNIKGSFPSPDDLMNIAPLLTEDLEQSSPALIGQSIMPVAYVVVRKNANINENSNNVIEIADLIDIRPFFRTTELAYNERAGLAAATPQVSLANPVATEGYVDYVAKALDNKIAQITGVNTQQTNILSSLPRIIGAGYVLGGTNYGVEGTLRDFLLKTTTPNANNVDVRNVFDYPSNIIINSNPDWDLASWLSDSDITGGSPGTTKYDWINYAISKSPDQFGLVPPNNPFADNLFLNDNSTAYGPMSTQVRDFSSSGRPIGFGTWPTHELFNSNGGYYTLFYVSKTIKINRSLVPWMADYRVNVRLHNCVPLSSRILGADNNNLARFGQGASISNVWVSKKRVSTNDFEFTIFVGWTADDIFRQEGDTFLLPKIARARNTISGDTRRPINFNGFAVITKDMLNQRDINDLYPWNNGRPNTLSTNFNPSYYSSGGNKIGAALYPTVSFEVVGIPSNYNPGQSLNSSNPYLTIVS